jgi:mono/diheme cytochrome c family protein
MGNIGGLVILVGVATSLAWLGVWAWEIENRFFKGAGAGLAGLLAAAFSVAGVLAVVGLVKMHSRSAPIPDIKVIGTQEQIQRGQAIADSFCSGCHSKTDPLTGGFDVGGELPIPIGSFVSSNLTPAGQLGHWSDGQIFRAIRNGVDAEGRWLTIMSYTNAGRLSDDDIAALIAYLRRQPAAGRPTVDPPDRFNLLGIVMLGAGMLPGGKPVLTGTITAPPKGPTPQYGEYILSYQDCRECHGAHLTGGVDGQLAPIGPDLSLVKGWRLQEFMETLRTGTDPDGHELSKQMPWRPIGTMDDDELRAVYEYLTHLPDSQNTAAN